jgi:transposase
VLEGVLKGFYTQIMAERGSIMFQQDGAPSHTSKSTKQWFSQNHINLLFLPASSPNLNPIEPVWHELKWILRGLPKPPNTVEQQQAAILAAWEDLAIEDINKHVNRMSDRVEAVAKAKGGHTRF